MRHVPFSYLAPQDATSRDPQLRTFADRLDLKLPREDNGLPNVELTPGQSPRVGPDIEIDWEKNYEVWSRLAPVAITFREIEMIKTSIFHKKLTRIGRAISDFNSPTGKLWKLLKRWQGLTLTMSWLGFEMVHCRLSYWLRSAVIQRSRSCLAVKL